MADTIESLQASVAKLEGVVAALRAERKANDLKYKEILGRVRVKLGLDVSAHHDKIETALDDLLAGADAADSVVQQARAAATETTIAGRTAKIAAERDEAVKAAAGLKTERDSAAIGRALDQALVGSGILAPSMVDAQLRARDIFCLDDKGNVLTREGVADVPPHLSPKEWVNSCLKSQAPHFWPPSVSGGARGTGRGSAGAADFGEFGGKNPWSKVHWNVTRQFRAVQQLGTEKAAMLARMGGSQLGSPTPPEYCL
jgi:hypothetical protein